MKKLFAAFLTLTLLAGLTLPALAAETSADIPVPEIAPINAQVDDDLYWRLLEAAVTETVEATAEAYPGAGAYDEDYDWEHEEEHDWEAEWAAYEAEMAALRQEAIDARKLEMGGVPGEYGVMVNGEYIQLGGGKIIAENGVMLVPQDEYLAALGLKALPPALTAGPYLRDGVWYVGLRQVAEHAGYTVWWDAQFETAVLIHREETVAKYDKQLSTINRLLSREMTLLGDGSARGMLDLDVTVTMLNSIDGDQSYDFSMDMTYHSSATAADMDIVMNLSDLSEMLAPYLSLFSGGDPETSGMISGILSMLNKVTVTLRYDITEGTLYAQAPLLALVVPGLGADDWIAIDYYDAFAYADMAEGYQPGQAVTAGTIAWNAFSVAYNGYYYAGYYSTEVDETTPVFAWQGITEGMDRICAMLGNSSFRPEGNWSTLTIGLDDMLALLGLSSEDEDMYTYVNTTLAEFDLKLTVRPDDNYTLDCTFRPQMTTMGISTLDCRVTLQIRADGKETSVNAEVHVKNQMKIGIKMTQSWTASSLPVANTPPEGANILEL